MPKFVALVFSASVGFHTLKNHTTITYYSIHPGTPLENCLPYESPVECEIGIPTCRKDIPGVGLSMQLYADRFPIVDSDRFRCLDPLEEPQ